MSCPTLFNVSLKEIKPTLPVELEDVFGGILHNKIVITCGFGGHIKEGAARRFYTDTYAIEIKDVLSQEVTAANEGKTKSLSKISYQKLPDFPARGRQKGASFVYHDRLYCWGGFNYTPAVILDEKTIGSKKKDPKAFKDGYVLEYSEKKWVWKRLPDLPYYLAAFSLTVIGNYVYLFGGCDYYDSSFNTWNDRNGDHERFGAQLYRMDLLNLEKSLDKIEFQTVGGEILNWEKLSECQNSIDGLGTPRMNHVGINVNDKLYILGGMSGRPFGGKAYSAVDNWVYDPAKNLWQKIQDSPSSNTNWQSGVSFMNRYVLLVGGASTTNHGQHCSAREVIDSNQTVRSGYGEIRHNKFPDYLGIMCGDIIIYDVETNSFGKMNDNIPLPTNLNNPLVLLVDDILIILGGEVEISGQTRNQIRTKLHCYSSDVFWIGQIKNV